MSVLLIILLIFRLRKIDKKVFHLSIKIDHTILKNISLLGWKAFWTCEQDEGIQSKELQILVNKINDILVVDGVIWVKRIRTKGLLSILGFGVLSLAFIKFVWTWVGYILFTQISFNSCNYEFKRTYLSNIFVPIVCLSPIGFTFVMFFIIKITNVLLSWLMPSTFIWISKRIWSIFPFLLFWISDTLSTHCIYILPFSRILLFVTIPLFPLGNYFIHQK